MRLKDYFAQLEIDRQRGAEELVAAWCPTEFCVLPAEHDGQCADPRPVGEAEQSDATRDLANRLRLTPLLIQRRELDDEFSRGWNAACRAMRLVLEQEAGK